jgi:uncharacterized protein DUF6152
MARVYSLFHSLVAALGKLWNADKQSCCANAKQSQESNHKQAITRWEAETSMNLKRLGNLRRLGFAGMAAVVCAAPAALAHHSFAMFDAGKLVTLEGTVKQFQWTNPHAWIILMVNEQEGQPPAQWAIEMNGPTGLARDGWLPKTLTPGMQVKVVIHPLRDGNKGGQYLAVTLPDGTLMGNPQGRGNPAPVRGE